MRIARHEDHAVVRARVCALSDFPEIWEIQKRAAFSTCFLSANREHSSRGAGSARERLRGAQIEAMPSTLAPVISMAAGGRAWEQQGRGLCHREEAFFCGPVGRALVWSRVQSQVIPPSLELLHAGSAAAAAFLP